MASASSLVWIATGLISIAGCSKTRRHDVSVCNATGSVLERPAIGMTFLSERRWPLCDRLEPGACCGTKFEAPKERNKGGYLLFSRDPKGAEELWGDACYQGFLVSDEPYEIRIEKKDRIICKKRPQS